MIRQKQSLSFLSSVAVLALTLAAGSALAIDCDSGSIPDPSCGQDGVHTYTVCEEPIQSCGCLEITIYDDGCAYNVTA